MGISLNGQDKYILEKFRDLICPKAIIKTLIRQRENGRTAIEHRFLFSSKRIHQYLTSIGFSNHKTANEPLILNHIPQEFHYDYLRGIIDGDGCIYTRKLKRKGESRSNTIIISSASSEFLIDIQKNICFNLGKVKRVGVTNQTYNIPFYQYKIFGTENILSILDRTYSNIENGYYLKRKYEKYLIIKNNILNKGKTSE